LNDSSPNHWQYIASASVSMAQQLHREQIKRNLMPSRQRVLAASDNYLATSDNYFKYKISPKRPIGQLLGAMRLLKKPQNN
jgi:hypothetical protein